VSARSSLRRLLGTRAGTRTSSLVVRAWSSALAEKGSRDALRELVRLHDLLYGRIDSAASRLDEGVHVKHRLIGYHDFFLERVQPGDRVLDVGCGKGELAHDLAESAGADVTGIDVSRHALAFARVHRASPRLELREADAYEFEPDAPYDVLVLSNVLEHLTERPELLRRLVAVAQARLVLIRVPLLERDWLVALRRDLGLPYFGDPTHELEYDPATFRAELGEAGLEVDELELRWGEIWAAARPRR